MHIRSKRWHLYPHNVALSEKLGAHLTVDPVIAQLLLNRGIRSLEQAQAFLQPREQASVHFPREDLLKATHCIQEAIANKRGIFVYGDYDVDGMTSTAMMASMLKQLGAHYSFMIPNRFLDGYGVSGRALDFIKANDVGLFITLDCGISNRAEIEQIKRETSCRVVIFDHHTIPDVIPDADAILNPKFLSPDHALWGLCTAGIVYKFWEFYGLEIDTSVSPDGLLDLAALGTVADVAPLVSENRRMTSLGLELLSSRKRVGIRALLDVAGFDRSRVTPRDIGFMIAPRLNAAGRLGDAKICVELLMSEDFDEATKLARTLNQLNEDRRFYCESLMNEAVNMVEKNPNASNEKVIVLAGEGWHAGIIGIIASRLVERYGKPTILISGDGTLARGSGRSAGEVDLYMLLKSCDSFFTTFGGHKSAAGFSMDPAHIPSFQAALIEEASRRISDRDLLPILDLECELHPHHLTLSLASLLNTLEPFGQDNPVPLFYAKGLRPIAFKTVGGGKHLKATFTDASQKVVIDAIGFNLHEKLSLLYKDEIELAFSLDINEWNGRQLPQLNLVDIQ
jgi:single-stranded-DNA-specific exonuclease